MSRNFLFVLLSLTIPGLLWGAQDNRTDGAAMDNNEELSKTVETEGGSPVAPGVIRMPYVPLRSASRVPRMLWRMFTWLPRRVASIVAQSLSRLMVAVKVYATDALGYLASSERTDMMRVRRGVPAPSANTSGSKPTSRGFNFMSTLVRLLTYPLKVAWRTGYNAVRFAPLAGTLNMSKSLLSTGSGLLNNTLVQKAGNVTMDVVDFAVAEAWNFSKVNVFPRLDGLVNNLKDSGSVPETLMAVLIELQTLYHIFKFLGMA